MSCRSRRWPAPRRAPRSTRSDRCSGFAIASVTGNPAVTQTGTVPGTPGTWRRRARRATRQPGRRHVVAGSPAVAGHGHYDGYDGTLATLSAVTTQDRPALPAGRPPAGIIRALVRRRLYQDWQTLRIRSSQPRPRRSETCGSAWVRMADDR